MDCFSYVSGFRVRTLKMLILKNFQFPIDNFLYIFQVKIWHLKVDFFIFIAFRLFSPLIFLRQS